ncbi:MAG: histidine phosphatase family protein [Clostridia bacterium]|nr:histidine phosphatase family protein [Clostridia bacterium]
MLYVARHGQTEWNVQGRICGVTDVALTEEGRAQADALAKEVMKTSVDLIISSPLGRALETARIVSERCGIPMQTDARLVEHNYGTHEGIHRDDAAFWEVKSNPACRHPMGESAFDVAHRIYGFLDEIKETYAHKSILLVTHGGLCRILRTYFCNMTNEELLHYQKENAKLEIYEF